MTHLKIEQNTTGIEEVSASIISKLYELVYAGLDANSNLLGRLHSAVGVRSQIQWLTSTYPSLYINADDYAIEFEDPKMVTYLNSIGVGSNGIVTEALAAAATIVANSANTEVTKFNELKYFTGITGSKGGWNPGTDGNIKFINWTALEEVDISNFTSLGHGHRSGSADTFYGCTSLKKVTASNKLILIGHCAFRDCSNLEDITGLSGEIELACNAFGGCSKLKNSNFTNVLFLVGGHDRDGSGFQNCTALTSLLISLNSTEIPVSLFEGCNNLTSVTGLQNITVIKSYVFKNCSKLSSIDIDWTKITRIEGESFNGCQLLPIASLNCTSLLILDTPNAFKNCKLLQSITSLGTITTISQASFNGCTGLTSVTLPSTLTTLGNEAFYGCSSLASIDLSNITTILLKAFNGCTSLTSVDLSSITDLGQSAFEGCTLLSSLNRTTFSGITRLHAAVFKNCSSLTGELSFPDLTELIFENGIRGSQFQGCANLTKISLGHIAIMNYAFTADNDAPFKNCTNLKIVDLGDSLTTLGPFNFTGCINLKAVVINTTTVPSITHSTNNSFNADIYNMFATNNAIVYVPDAALNNYKSAAQWSNFQNNIKGMSEYNEASILAS